MAIRTAEKLHYLISSTTTTSSFEERLQKKQLSAKVQPDKLLHKRLLKIA
jgi:hypothetical protein